MLTLVASGGNGGGDCHNHGGETYSDQVMMVMILVVMVQFHLVM